MFWWNWVAVNCDDRDDVPASLQAVLATGMAPRREDRYQSAVEFGRVMHLDQHIHPQLVRTRFQLRHQAMIQCGHYQQDAIGAPGERFIYLVRVDDEVFA